MASNSTKRKQDDAVTGVGVDEDARRLHEPVTVVVSPLGNEYDADTWSDANNFLGMGYAIKEGYPTGPVPTDPNADGDHSTAGTAATAGPSTPASSVSAGNAASSASATGA